MELSSDQSKALERGVKSFCVFVDNDPSAGSPTETLLRLLLPLDARVSILSPRAAAEATSTRLLFTHQFIQSVGATGGVYKGQGRSRHRLMICIY